MGYSNSTNIIIYFDYEENFIKRSYHCYIDEYDVNLHQE